MKDPDCRVTGAWEIPFELAKCTSRSSQSPTSPQLAGERPTQSTQYLPLDLPVSCLVPKSPAAVATSGARRRWGQLGPLLSLSQASRELVGPGASRAGDRGDTRMGPRGPGHPRRVTL